MKNNLILLCFVLLFFAACKDNVGRKEKNRKENKQEEIENIGSENDLKSNGGNDLVINPYYKKTRQVIKGFIKNGAHANVILDQLNIGEINPLISVNVLEDNSFYIETDIYEPGIYQLRFAHASIHLFLRGGEVIINSDISDIGSYEIIGSPESYHLKEMYLILNELNNKVHLVQDRIDQYKKDKTKTRLLIQLVDSQSIYYAAIEKEKSQRLMSFIERIDTSMVGLLAAMYMDVEKNYDFLIKTRDRFEKICPHSRIFKQFNDKISSIVPIKKGYEAPLIEMQDYLGNEQSLADQKGKVVLIFFWASYSEVARAEIPFIKSAFDKYKDKGFTVFAYSMDENRNEWKDAIIADNISSWIHVSSLTGWADEIAHVYRIGVVPELILVDKQGIIIDKGIKAAQLESILKKYF